MIALRSEFLSSTFGYNHAESQAKLIEQYQALDRLSANDQIVLWFEHDSYDQLILAFLLCYLHGRSDFRDAELICISDHPQIRRFLGLGQLCSAQLNQLWHRERIPIGPDRFDLGARIWPALTSSDPRDLLAISDEDADLLPWMGPAA